MRPLGLWLAIVLFGVPALIFRALIYAGMPALMHAGAGWLETYLLCYGSFLLLLTLAALAGYRLEGRRFSRAGLAGRLRLQPSERGEWGWVFAGFLVAGGGYLAVSFTERRVAGIPGLAPPAVLAYLDPRRPSRLSYPAFMGVPLHGNWLVLVAVFVLLVLNVVGEELWWRGYILPRQEIRHGSKAWLANGLLWSAFHTVFYPWTVISYLPICLAIPYVAQRRKNTRSAMAIHFVLNGFHLLVPVTLGVLGVHA